MIFLLIIGTLVVTFEYRLQLVEARNEQIIDASNNNLVLSLNAPDNWNSGIFSQSISNLNWRLYGLDVFNDDKTAFFVVVNSPSYTNFALSLGQKTGILSIILSQYVTINSEKDITSSDGLKAHQYSISVTADQLHRLNAPIYTGFDVTLITTKQGDSTYIIAFATQLGRMNEFDNIFQNILNSVKFGEVGFSTSNTNN